MNGYRSVAAVTLATLLLAMPASPGGLRCRSDPLIVLVNADLTKTTVVDASADIDGWLWDVRTVDYKIRVPVGMKVLLAVRTPSWPTTKETFTIEAVNPPGRFETDTVVHTKTTGVGVTANLLVKTLSNIVDAGSVDGLDRQVLKLGMTVR